MNFQIRDAADARDRAAWLELWSQWPGREVFAHPDYVRLYAGEQVKPLCAIGSAGDSHVLYPFLLRALGSEPYCEGGLRNSTDIVSPYGYGGPFGWGAQWTAEGLGEFWRAFNVWAQGSGVVSEFVRLSLFPGTLVDYPGRSRALSENVVRVLRPAEELWNDFEYKVRKNVKKALAAGVRVEADETGERLDDFLAIYTGTMTRRHAAPGYYFPRAYFERIRDDLRGQFVYFHATAGGRVISSELVLVSAERVYSFLGGTDEEWFSARPNDLLKFEIMKWAYGRSKREFVLGGGYTPGDGIYRFKLSFAPQGQVPFAVGSRILNADAYDQLVGARRRFAARQGTEWRPNPDYFPVYRA